MGKDSSKHYITDEILNLIKQAIADNRGSKAAFCRMTKIKPYNLSKLLSGEKKFVFGDDWNKLCSFFPEFDDRSIKHSFNQTNNGTNNGVIGINHGTVGADCLSHMIDRIIATDELTAEEKVKVIKVLKQ